jgi:hypothetical protein
LVIDIKNSLVVVSATTTYFSSVGLSNSITSGRLIYFKSYVNLLLDGLIFTISADLTPGESIEVRAKINESKELLKGGFVKTLTVA